MELTKYFSSSPIADMTISDISKMFDDTNVKVEARLYANIYFMPTLAVEVGILLGKSLTIETYGQLNGFFKGVEFADVVCGGLPPYISIRPSEEAHGWDCIVSHEAEPGVVDITNVATLASTHDAKAFCDGAEAVGMASEASE